MLKKRSGIACPARTLHEEVLQTAVVTAVNDVWSQGNSVIPVLQKNIREMLENDTEVRLETINSSIKEKQTELLKAGNDQNRIDEIGDAIIRMREQRQDILVEAAQNKERKERVDDLATFLGEQVEAITEYLEPLVRRLIERIVVYDEKMMVVFKSGLEIEVEI